MQTIFEAPQGQKPKIMAFAAARVPQLLAADAAVAPAFLVLLRGCLAGLRIDLTTSAALASALELLITDSLALPLTDLLPKVCDCLQGVRPCKYEYMRARSAEHCWRFGGMCGMCTALQTPGPPDRALSELSDGHFL